MSILYLRTHPEESRYTEDPGARGPTRRQYLYEKYNMHPRSLLNPQDPLYAGWKGTVFTGQSFTQQVFWIDQRAASFFADAAIEIRHFHRINNTSKSHPYFFVNILDRTGLYFGLPTKMSRAEKAFSAACVRVGLEPHRFGRSIHGLRHYYKHAAENKLGMGPMDIQIMLGHRSVVSQDDYGRDARMINLKLSEAANSRAQNRFHIHQ